VESGTIQEPAHPLTPSLSPTGGEGVRRTGEGEVQGLNARIRSGNALEGGRMALEEHQTMRFWAEILDSAMSQKALRNVPNVPRRVSDDRRKMRRSKLMAGQWRSVNR